MTKKEIAGGFYLSQVEYYRAKGEELPGTKTLARDLMYKYPTHFPKIEIARSALREALGKQGNARRNKAIIEVPHNPPSTRVLGVKHLINIEREPFILPDGQYVCLYDCHVPYLDEDAFNAVIAHAPANPTGVFLGGDFIDFHAISRFVHDVDAYDVAKELRIAKRILGRINDLFGNCPIYYLLGNHEERMQSFMYGQGRPLAKLALNNDEDEDEDELVESDFFWKMGNLINAKRYNVTMIEDRRRVKAGDLNIFHGHEVSRSIFTPVSAARSLLMKTKEPSLCGHHHVTSHYREKRVSGEFVEAWTVGCLCPTSAYYAPYDAKNHGYAIIECQGKDFHVDNRMIVNGVVR